MGIGISVVDKIAPRSETASARVSIEAIRVTAVVEGPGAVDILVLATVVVEAVVAILLGCIVRSTPVSTPTSPPSLFSESHALDFLDACIASAEPVVCDPRSMMVESSTCSYARFKYGLDSCDTPSE
jgi:hypothetical protein